MGVRNAVKRCAACRWADGIIGGKEIVALFLDLAAAGFLYLSAGTGRQVVPLAIAENPDIGKFYCAGIKFAVAIVVAVFVDGNFDDVG